MENHITSKDENEHRFLEIEENKICISFHGEETETCSGRGEEKSGMEALHRNIGEKSYLES